ncbi:hypothetical protein SUGI_1139860 [Cryptomeria japonica]|nr:hypothetical protein SUGI_1139860 [Cryptomeria japonica]
MGKRSDIGKKFMILFMVILILGGAFMVEAAIGDCKIDGDCGPGTQCCLFGGETGFCCDPNFTPPDEALNH